MSQDRVLYVSYDGALDPLGRSQILPYLLGLAERGFSFELMSFEKRAQTTEQQLSETGKELASRGIEWHPLTYRKRPPALATAFDLAIGVRVGFQILRSRDIGLIHARSYPAAAIAWRLSRKSGIPFLFDMRGLYPEERTEGGLWRADGVLFKITKALERRFVRDAAGIVTLTQASVPLVQAMMKRAGTRCPLAVIPTCVDTDRFRLARASSPFTLAYFGSIGTWYMLDEMLGFASAVFESVPGSRVLFVVNGSPEIVMNRAAALGLDLLRIRVLTVTHERVPEALAEASATFHFIRPTFSKRASAPTKFAESLALGLPVVVNRGVGDSSEIVEKHSVGVVIDRHDLPTYRMAALQIHALASKYDVRARCRAVAEELFSLKDGLDQYERLYRTIR